MHKKYLVIIILSALLLLSFVSCELEDMYNSSNNSFITSLTIQNNYVLIECGEEQYLYFPQIDKWQQKNSTLNYGIKLVQIEEYLLESVYWHGGYIFLKKSTIKEIYNYYGLTIPDNIELLEKNSSLEKNSFNEAKGVWIIILMIGILIIVIPCWIMRISYIDRPRKCRICEAEIRRRESGFKQLICSNCLSKIKQEIIKNDGKLYIMPEK